MYQLSKSPTIKQAALAHLGERQTEVHFKSRITANSGGTVFDPQKNFLTSGVFESIFAGAIGSAFDCYSRIQVLVAIERLVVRAHREEFT
jgi:hypothetical protein